MTTTGFEGSRPAAGIRSCDVVRQEVPYGRTI